MYLVALLLRRRSMYVSVSGRSSTCIALNRPPPRLIPPGRAAVAFAIFLELEKERYVQVLAWESESWFGRSSFRCSLRFSRASLDRPTDRPTDRRHPPLSLPSFPPSIVAASREREEGAAL